MLHLALAGRPNVTLLPIPDLDDGPRWRAMVAEMLGALDLFVTDNPYVASLLKDTYPLERPIAFVPLNERIPVSGSLVRQKMARGEDWQVLVPPEIAAYITENKLDERFRREFGLETLAQAARIIVS
jgi:nicotinamide mononucleotide adenylyltransferase